MTTIYLLGSLVIIAQGITIVMLIKHMYSMYSKGWRDSLEYLQEHITKVSNGEDRIDCSEITDFCNKETLE